MGWWLARLAAGGVGWWFEFGGMARGGNGSSLGVVSGAARIMRPKSALRPSRSTKRLDKLLRRRHSDQGRFGGDLVVSVRPVQEPEP